MFMLERFHLMEKICIQKDLCKAQFLKNETSTMKA